MTNGDNGPYQTVTTIARRRNAGEYVAARQSLLQSMIDVRCDMPIQTLTLMGWDMAGL